METLTEEEAFQAMKCFLVQFAERAGNDLVTLVADLTMGRDGEPLDPAAWSDWLRCVRAVTESRQVG